METTLIKLQVKKEAASGKLSAEITSKFIEACIKLDASIFEPLVKEDQYFQDLDKYRFLQSLKDEFEKVKLKGIEKTTPINGTCLGCEKGHSTYQFYGNKLQPEFSYIITKKENKIQDIFICNMSSGTSIINMQILKNYDFWM